MIKRFAFILYLLVFSNGYAQNEAAIDSLKKEILRYDNSNKNQNSSILDSVKVKALLGLSRAYRDFSPNQSMEYVRKALVLSGAIHYEKGVANAYCVIGNIYNNKGDFFYAIDNFTKAAAISNKIKDEKTLGDSYLYLGQSYLFLNNFPEALKHIQTALSIYERHNEKLMMGRAYNNLGILYNKQGKFKEELANYSKALKILNTLDKNEDTVWLINTINGNTANLYMEQKKYKQSLEILFKCVEIDVKLNRINNSALDYQSIGINYSNLNENDKAYSYLSKSLGLFQQMNNKSGEGDGYRHIGEFYLKTGDLKKALENTQKGLDISKQIGELESIKFGYEVLTQIYKKNGDYKAAFESQVSYKRYSDSILNSEISKKLIQIQMTDEFEKKQNILKKQQFKKDELLRAAADKQTRIIYIVLATLFLLSLLTIGIYRNLKNYQRQRNIIQKQKEQIENSLQEKETLLREIHHRVKNNLQIITSLLNMQSEEINDAAVLASIQEGQSRVQAMSLIHQNLYQSEQVNKVDVENYLRELVDYLSKMFEGNSKNIEVKIDTFNIQFDFDTAIPLGLIVNELVSNAFKYGFSAGQKGSIWISIRAIEGADYELKVSDNGDRLPADFDIKNLKTLGLKLVSILSRQLRGNFSVETKELRTSFVVLFKDLKVYNANLEQ